MNRIVWVAIVALCSPMFAGAAYGGDITGAFCKGFETKLERLCDIDESSCDRLTTGFKAACGAVGTIYASPAADSVALDLLRRNYDVVTVDENFPARFLAAPVVVAAPDLDDPAFTSLLNFAHDAGETVAIVDATQDEADRFANFFGASGANCLPASGSSTIELYGLQESRTRKPRLSSSYCLVGLSSLDRSGEQAALHWLRQRFAASAPAPSPPEPTTGVAASNNIVDLATAINCSSMNGNDPAGQGRVLTQDAYITGARSFLNSQDIYYVENELQYTQGRSTNPDYGYQVTRFGATGVLNFRRGLSKSQPSTVTQYQDSFTNETTQTISVSVGFNADGPSGTIGNSVTHGESNSFTIPATTILNNSVNPLPAWQFHRQNTAGNTYGPQTSWFWTVPWGDYADGGAGSKGRMQFTSALTMGNDFVGETACSVPYPFEGILQVGAPVITSVEPQNVHPGQKFTITGAQLYPGMVNAILLGGDSVGDSNFTDNGETAPDSGVFTVDVIVPGSQRHGNNTVVAQQTFNSKARFSNVDKSINVIGQSE
jgi:hypothetical protein